MDAIILVGGQGTRLRPLTTTRHKSLVPLLNRPAIEYLFEWLARSGIERAVLALGQANEDLAATYPAGLRGGLEIVGDARGEILVGELRGRGLSHSSERPAPSRRRHP